MADKDEGISKGLFDFAGPMPPAGELVPLGLQHVLAAVVGVITPSIIVATACGLSAEEKIVLIQVALVVTALSTLLQVLPLFNRIGAGLPVIMGTSFAYVPTLVSIGGEFGLATIMGAELIGGCVAVVFGIFLKQIRRFFPPLVTGTVVFTIGLSLYPTAVGYMAGGTSSADFGSAANWLVAIITLVAVVGFSYYGKGVLKLGSLLFGMLIGYVVALAMGMVDFSDVATSGWFALPQFMVAGIDFQPAACASLAIVFVVNSVQAIGDFSATTTGGLDRMPTDRELSGGIIGEGLIAILASLFGGLPTSTYAQNVGIVSSNKVVNRNVFVFAALVLLVAGLVPKFSAILTTIPYAVIGGATVTVFASIAMTGIRMIIQGGLTQRKVTVAGLSVAIGIGITEVSGCLAGAGFPGWVTTVFGSSAVTVATILAIVLNQALPNDPEDDAPEPAIADRDEASAASDSTR